MGHPTRAAAPSPRQEIAGSKAGAAAGRTYAAEQISGPGVERDDVAEIRVQREPSCNNGSASVGISAAIGALTNSARPAGCVTVAPRDAPSLAVNATSRRGSSCHW
jgi:hypothetical protein